MTDNGATPQWAAPDVSRLAESVQALAVQVAENNAILRTSMSDVTRRVEETEDDVEELRDADAKLRAELQDADRKLRAELASLSLTVSSTAALLHTTIKVALWALGVLVTVGVALLAWALPHVAWN